MDYIDRIDLESDKSVKLMTSALALYGLYHCGRIALNGARSFLKYFVLPRKNLYARYGGGWALITGASDGLGKQYAFELAKEGFNIILMARNRQKLMSVAQEIEAAYPSTKTAILIFDFAALATDESIKKLERIVTDEAQDKDVSILINNVGVNRSQVLHKFSVEQLTDLVNVNINAQTYMS